MQTSGAKRASASDASATEPAGRGLVPELLHEVDERFAGPRLVLDDEDLHEGGPPAAAGAGSGQERSGDETALPLREPEVASVGFDACAGEEELLGALLAAGQLEEPVEVRLAGTGTSDDGLDPEGYPPGGGGRVYPRRRSPGLPRTQEPPEHPKGVDRRPPSQQDVRPGRRVLLERDAGATAEIADRDLHGRFRHDAARVVAGGR